MTTILCIAEHDDEHPARQPLDGLRICRWHHRKTKGAIMLMPSLYDLLTSHLTGASIHTTDLVHTSPTPGLSLNPKVLEARSSLAWHLKLWARIGLEEGPWDIAPADTMLDVAKWITLRLDWYSAQNWTDDFVNESITLVNTARRLQQPNRIAQFVVGKCPEPDCTGTLISEMRPADDKLPSLIWCDREAIEGETAHQWPADQWLILGRQVKRIEESA